MNTHLLPRAQRDSLSYLAVKVAGLGASELTELMASEGLKRSHFTVVSALADFGPLSQSALAEHTGLNRGHLVGFLDELERHGSLKRTPDPTDRRRNIVVLTEPGRAFAARVFAAEQANEQRLFGTLDRNEQGELKHLLTRVLQAALSPEAEA